jgi:hypothetical protein
MGFEKKSFFEKKLTFILKIGHSRPEFYADSESEIHFKIGVKLTEIFRFKNLNYVFVKILKKI